MKSQYRTLFGFIALLLVVSLACGPTNTPPTPIPTNIPPTVAPPPAATEPNEPVSSGSGLVTFTDQNSLLAFDLPGDWTSEHAELGDAVYLETDAYSDTFTAPDQSAIIESLVITTDETLDNSVSAGAALDLLHRYYSFTGKVGDIRISSDQIMQDGSERLEWTSKGGGYSGVSFFELRGKNKKTWLMFTAWWDDDADQATLDTVNDAISSYNIP